MVHPSGRKQEQSHNAGVRSAPGSELAFFDFDTPDMTHPLCAVYKANSYLRPIARAFIDVTKGFFVEYTAAKT